MALSVKAYINPDTDKQEIRRFAIDEGASANFSYLVQKIEQVFPSVRGRAFTLYWKDSDNEMITFSSDEELVEALGSFSGNVFRVYVKQAEKKDAAFIAGEDAHEPQADQAHPGVVCDGCEKDIFGVRFKCAVCPNFDLCLMCETKGLHKQHEMLRIATPRNTRDWFQGFGPFGAHFPPHHPPPPHIPPHHPPHIPPHHPPHVQPPFGFPPFDHGHGFGPWGSGLGGWGGHGGWGGRGRCGKNQNRCGKEGHKCDRHGQTNTGEIPVGPPFLHAVGETIASFLGPFGVEVHTYASNEADCCKGKCQGSDEPSAEQGGESPQPGPSGESTTQAPAGDTKDEGTQKSCDETSEMEIPQEEFVMINGIQVKGSAPAGADQDVGASEATAFPDIPADPLEVAIAQMRSMGFEDDSGWLSQLIVSKGYDVGKVLDAIQFSGKD